METRALRGSLIIGFGFFGFSWKSTMRPLASAVMLPNCDASSIGTAAPADGHRWLRSLLREGAEAAALAAGERPCQGLVHVHGTDGRCPRGIPQSRRGLLSIRRRASTAMPAWNSAAWTAGASRQPAAS